LICPRRFEAAINRHQRIQQDQIRALGNENGRQALNFIRPLMTRCPTGLPGGQESFRFPSDYHPAISTFRALSG